MEKGKVKTEAPNDVIFLDLGKSTEYFVGHWHATELLHGNTRLLTMDLVTDNIIGSLGT